MSQALPGISDIKLIRTDTTLDLVLNHTPYSQRKTTVQCFLGPCAHGVVSRRYQHGYSDRKGARPTSPVAMITAVIRPVDSRASVSNTTNLAIVAENDSES